jgi:DNA ligase-1
MSAPFIQFCETADAVAATTKRLEKAALLGAYFATLDDDDLARAARWMAGTVFPMHDQRTTMVGGRTLMALVDELSGCDPDELRARLVALGDLGDLAGQCMPERSPALSLAEVEEAFATLAATSGSLRKQALARALFERAARAEAKYLIKLLSGDLRVGLREGAVEDAVARAARVTVERIQWTNMLIGDVGETAVLARHGRLEQARMRLFHPLKFMLATPAADLSDVARQMPPSFVVEDKYDGIRAQAHVSRDGGRVVLFSRTLDDITESFPDLVEPLARLVNDETPDVIVDGEILPVNGEVILPFQVLQGRLGRRKLTAAMLESAPAAFMAYDLLYAGGEVLLETPFVERRARLQTLAFDGGRARLAPSRLFDGIGELDDEFTAARARGNEGLMVKDPRSAYKPGRRGREWLKIKRALATLDCVVTAVEVGNGRRAKLLSDYTFAVRASEDDPTLLNVGKAYSGLTDAELAEMSEWFRAHTLQEFWHGKVRVVEPRIVVEVTFDRVQPSKRHKSGYALRFPRILRLRPDKTPQEADTLDTVRRLAGESNES